MSEKTQLTHSTQSSMCEDDLWNTGQLQRYQSSGGRLNIKMLSYQYRDPYVKDKTVSRPSYL